MMGKAETQGALWSKQSQDWAIMQEPLHSPLWEIMLDKILTGSGTHFLDAGCGGGGASVLAAERGAQVSGLDAAEGLIAFARERMPNGDFRVGDIESLPYDNGVFDAVFAANAVQYSENRVNALRELGRVCKPKGRVVASLFSHPEKVQFSVIFKAIGDAMPKSPSGGGPFELSAPGILESLFEDAGLNVIESGEVNCPFSYSDFDEFWRANAAAGPFQGMIQVIGEEKLKTAVTDAVEEFRLDNGGYLIEPNFFKYVVATH
ncbi:MAG: class I SAM-dependent methyltransferase [Chloroflexota bacterium]